jgi:hypothetical protein
MRNETCESCGRDLPVSEICEYCGFDNHKRHMGGWTKKSVKKSIEIEKLQRREIK